MGNFKNNCQMTDEYVEFTNKAFPNEIFVCRSKLDPSTCPFVIVYGGIGACGRCKNFINKKELTTQK